MPMTHTLSFGLQGRVVIVTGAANGIGEACARRFAAEQAHVVLADVNSERGSAVAAELRSQGHSAGFMACDVSRKADVDALVDHVLQAFGRIDVLVNNAGITRDRMFLGAHAARQKWGNLPEAHTDFIFAVIGEELGLLGTLFILVLLGTLIYSALRISMRTTDSFTRFACAGIAAWISIQTVLNIGSAVSLLPVVGRPDA